MTPKEKAIELMQKAYDLDEYNKTSNKRCKNISLMLVDEIIKSKTTSNHITIFDPNAKTNPEKVEFWEEVKQEIEKL